MGPTLMHIVVVVLKRNGLMEILWSSMMKANLNCWLNHGLSKVIFTHLVPRVFLMSITSFIHGKACKKNIGDGHQWSKWLPRSLELRFGGQKEVDVDEFKGNCKVELNQF